MITNLPPSLRWTAITAIEPAGHADCVCITVDHPSGCYVTGSTIVTHNSDVATPVDMLPDAPRRFVDYLLSGGTPATASRAAGFDRGVNPEALATSIGRLLASHWNASGVDAQTALRQLQARAENLPLAASPKRRANPIAAASYNHMDKWLHAQLAGLSSKAGLPEFLAKIAENAKAIPFFGRAIEVLKEQAMPLESVPAEAMSLWREMQMRQAFGKELALDVQRSLKGEAKFTDIAYPPGFADSPTEKKRLYLYMTGQLEPGQVSPEMHDLALRLRALMSEAGEEAVRQGRMSPDTLLALQDTYLPHYYEDDLKRDTVWRKAARLIGVRDVLAQRTTAWHIVDTQRPDPLQKGENALLTWDTKGSRWRFNSEEHRNAFYENFVRDKALEDLQSAGPKLTDLLAALPKAEKNEVRNEIARLQRSDIDRPEKLTGPVRGIVQRTIQMQRQRFLKRAPLSVEDQEKAGLIFDPVYSTVRYLAQMSKDNAVTAFFNQVATNPQWATDVPTLGYTQIPDQRTFGKLAGKHVLNSIADQVLAIAGDESPVMEVYDDLVRAWSSGKTVWNPGTHVRNFIGNLPFAQLSGTNLMNPANWGYYRDAGRILRDGGAALRELYEHGILGADYGSQELRMALRELLPDAALMGEEPAPKMLARVGHALFGRLPTTIKQGLEKTSALAHGIYKVTDDFFKVAAFLKAKEMGMTPEEAAAHVRKWYPFYDHIGSSSGIKFVRRLIPFLSFQREAVRIFGNAIKARPLSLAATMIIPYVITQISAAMMGLRDKDKEEAMKDLRGKLLFKGMTGEFPAFAMLLPWRSQGHLAQFDLSNVVPWANIIGRPTESGQTEDTLQYLARRLLTSSPVGNIVGATAMNEDPFSGRHITEADMTTAERNMERAKYVWNLLAPPLLGSNAAMLAGINNRSTNKTLERRNAAQTFLRAVMGIDVRNASPDLYRLAEDYRKAHQLQDNPAFSGGSTDQQRSRAALFGELAQDEPDLTHVARLLAHLRDTGKPVQSAEDINRLLFYRNPLMVVPGAHQQAFRASLSGESRQVLDDALQEFQHIKTRAPAIIARARSLMPAPTTNPEPEK